MDPLGSITELSSSTMNYRYIYDSYKAEDPSPTGTLEGAGGLNGGRVTTSAFCLIEHETISCLGEQHICQES